MLEIRNLRVRVEGKEILKGVSLAVRPGEVQVVMGPNGSGKSTLAYTLAGHPKYEVIKGKGKTQSQVTLDEENILEMSPDERARQGLFLAFQYPVTIEGVSVQNFLKQAYETMVCPKCNEGKSLDNCPKMSVLEFRKLLQQEAVRLKVNPELLKRPLNDGFSGGEKKRMEILQMLTLKPKYAVLDETDSGLDVDAIKIVAQGVYEAVKRYKTGVILITHYERILEYLKPNRVHVMVKGKIVESSGQALVNRLQKSGYQQYLG